jgi:hypothetical protein
LCCPEEADPEAETVNQLVIERTARRTASVPRPVRPARRPSTTPPAVRSAVLTGGPTGGPTAAPHEVRSVVGVAAGVLVVLVLAVWSFAHDWGRDPVVGPGELAADGGIVRVEGALSAARPQHAMPGMGTDEDPVADGDRRISVDVTLMAGTGELRYAAEDFVLEVDGEPAKRLVHRDVLPGEALPAGTSLSGTIMFDVPDDATVGMLSFAGGAATEVVLPAEAESAPAPTDDDAAGTTDDDAAGTAGAGHDDAGHGAGG